MVSTLRSMLLLLLLVCLPACVQHRDGSGGLDGDAADDDDTTAGDDDDDASDDDDSGGDLVVDDDDDDDDDSPGAEWLATEVMYAHTDDTLYSVQAEPPYTVTELVTFHAGDGSDVPNLTDLAVSLTGEMYAVSTNGVWQVAPGTGELVNILETSGEFFVALTFLSDGTLLAGSNSQLFMIDVDLGVMEAVTTFEEWSWAGDMVGLPDGFLYCAMEGEVDDMSSLVIYDYNLDQVVFDGATGVGSMFGVGYGNDVLFGFTDEGSILTIDPATGLANEVSSGDIRFWGAATNPVRWSAS
ncbi:MAG: hypothetical protein CL928_11585 [Deltaproteobacteria bacterium]|nr:hypothetical protein [Deltaproteobacteria bacterium]